MSDLKIMLREYCKEKGFYDYKEGEKNANRQRNIRRN